MSMEDMLHVTCMSAKAYVPGHVQVEVCRTMNRPTSWRHLIALRATTAVTDEVSGEMAEKVGSENGQTYAHNAKAYDHPSDQQSVEAQHPHSAIVWACESL